MTFPISFQPIALELWQLGATPAKVTGDAACTTPPPVAEEARCITHELALDTVYAIQVRPAGGRDCGGTCNYNDYTLTVQLGTP